MFGKNKIADVDDIQLDENGNPVDSEGNPIDGEVVEFDEDGNPIESDETEKPEIEKPVAKVDEKDNLMAQLTAQLADIQKQIVELKTPKPPEPKPEPELVKPTPPVKPKKPVDFDWAESGNVSSSTYKYLMDKDEYDSEFQEYLANVSEYQIAAADRKLKAIDNTNRMITQQQEQQSIKANMVAKLQAGGLTLEEAVSAYNDGMSGKLFDEEHIIALKMTERLKTDKPDDKTKKFDALKNKRERFGAKPASGTGGGGRNVEVLERDDFTKPKDPSRLYQPKK